MVKYTITVSDRKTKKTLLTEYRVTLADALKLFKDLSRSLTAKLYEVSLELEDEHTRPPAKAAR